MIMNAFREFIVSVEPQVIGLEAPMIGLGAGYCRTTQRMLLSTSLDWHVIGLGAPGDWIGSMGVEKKESHIHDKHVRELVFSNSGS